MEIVTSTAPSVFDLYDRGKKLLESYKDNKLRKTYRDAQQGRLNPALTDFLESYYPYSLLRAGDLSYPTFVLKSSVSQQQNPESILGKLTEATREDFIVYDKVYLEILKRQGKRMYNGRTYVMDVLEQDNEHRLNCSLGYYYDAMATCDVFEWEILPHFSDRERFLQQRSTDIFKDIGRQLKLRNQYAEQVCDPVRDGRGRSGMLSISTLIVFHDGKTYRAFLRMRSGKTAAHSDLYHVVPSFIFQPVTGFLREEYSTRHNIFREYLEEVFGVPETEHVSGEIVFDYFYDHARLRQLRKLLNSGGAELFLTGYAMNMLNLRPEICTLLLIRDTSWLKQKIVSNWEFLTQEQVYEQRQEVIIPIDVLQSERKIVSDLLSLPGTFVPPGAAAFWLGVERTQSAV